MLHHVFSAVCFSSGNTIALFDKNRTNIRICVPELHVCSVASGWKHGNWIIIKRVWMVVPGVGFRIHTFL